MKKVFSLLLVLLMVLSVAVPATAATKTKITLDKKGTVEMKLGETLQLKATVTPEAAVTWKSSKAKVATVKDGLVTAVSEGKATITAKAGGKTAKVKIKVVDPTKPTGLFIVQGKKVDLDIDKTLQLSIGFKPNTAYSNLTYKSSKPKVASVDKNGLIKPLKEGKTKITVMAKNNKKAKASITVKVVDPYKPTKINISNGKSATLKPGGKLKLSAVLSPASAKSTLIWKSKNTSVATVDAYGNVKALKAGTAKITVTAKNNKKAKATFTVKVKAPISYELAPWLGKSFGKFGKQYNISVKYVTGQTGYRDDEYYCKSGNFKNKSIEVSAETLSSNKAKLKNASSIIFDIQINSASQFTLFGVKPGMNYRDALATAKAYAAAHYPDWFIYDDGETIEVQGDDKLFLHFENGKLRSVEFYRRHPEII